MDTILMADSRFHSIKKVCENVKAKFIVQIVVLDIEYSADTR